LRAGVALPCCLFLQQDMHSWRCSCARSSSRRAYQGSAGAVALCIHSTSVTPRRRGQAARLKPPQWCCGSQRAPPDEGRGGQVDAVAGRPLPRITCLAALGRGETRRRRERSGRDIGIVTAVHKVGSSRRELACGHVHAMPLRARLLHRRRAHLQRSSCCCRHHHARRVRRAGHVAAQRATAPPMRAKP
jgi:hypothetical protein